MVEKIYIIRHGFRINWVTTNWTNPTGLPRDPPLAAFGEAQAREVGKYFLSLPNGERPTAIFSSPYYRCLQTSQPAAQELNLPLYVEHGLSEWYSPIAPGTGLHPRPSSASSLKHWFAEIDAEGWATTWYPSRRGEDVEGIHDRVDGFFTVFVPHLERVYPQHKVIMLVSHAAPIIALVRGLLGNRNMPFRVGCCCISEFVKKEGEEDWKVIGGWEAKRLADGSYLQDGALRDWGFEDIEVANGKVISDKGEGDSDEEDQPVGSQVPDIQVPITTRM